jgi:hypothetical protein
MIDVTREEPIGLGQIAERLGVSFPTVWRWCLRGLPGPSGERVRLEAGKLGGKWVSSWPALQRFLLARTPDLDDEPATLRSPAKQMKAATRAGKALEKIGF